MVEAHINTNSESNSHKGRDDKGLNANLLQGLGLRAASRPRPRLTLDVRTVGRWQMFFLASKGFRCIAHDRRGHGRSSQPSEGQRDGHLRRRPCCASQAPGFEESRSFIGFSTGGGEVARYIGRHGTKRVAKAVLVSSGAAIDGQNRKTTPEDCPIEVFDGFRAAFLADRSQFFKDVPQRAIFRLQSPGSQGLTGH